MRIALPEFEHPVIREAFSGLDGVEGVPAEGLAEACELVRRGEAEAVVAGIEFSSRDVILACRDGLGMTGSTFSGSFVLMRGDECYVIGDAAACKHPTAEQLYEIVCQTWETARAVLEAEPRVAMLSFSTAGSGGRDETIDLIREVVTRVRAERPEILIDGEMQLDAAVAPEVAAAKGLGESAVAGRANVWILPDLNTGNILYKAMERCGGFTAAGPILQGFRGLASDLSRGSSAEDVRGVVGVLRRLAEDRGGER